MSFEVFSSEWMPLEAPQEQVFAMACSLERFGLLLPEQIENWRTDGDSCSFTIKGMADITLRITEKQPHSLVRLQPSAKAPFPFSIDLNVAEEQGKSKVRVCLEADLNPLLSMMASKPLQNLVDTMAQRASSMWQ